MRDRISSALDVLVSFGLLVVALRYVTDFWLLSFFFSLQPQLGVVAAFGALVSLVLRRGAFAYVLLAASLLLCGHALWMQRELLPPATSDVAPGATRFRVLSFNVLGNNHSNVGRIIDMVNASGADVAYVMESAPLLHHLDALSTAYPHRIGCGVVIEACDLMILSKHPIDNPAFLSLSDLRSNRFAMATVHIAGQAVQLAAIHLTKPYFDTYHTTELRRAGAALRKRGGPIVIGGDFNSDTIAPDMQAFLRRHALQATGPEPATWPVAAGVFGVPIDHIYVSKDIVPLSLARMADNYGSNHYGLIADLALSPAR
ncbi:MAG: endonuclease/exonuclease/phosphatase family protein [Arenimonas sp.]|nr:endonuclease/exonuclease/phosphatase family protein [Rhizobium sp.]MBW8445869.1 endonuclease/exonuclease/phosphatase family protein [Arenimonas sp.]